MSLELAIQENTTALHTLIKTLQGMGNLEIVHVGAPSKPEKTKKEAAPSPEPVKDPVPEATSAPTPEPTVQEPAPEPVQESASAPSADTGVSVPFDVVKAALFKLVAKSNEDAVALLKKYGAAKLSEVEKDQYQAFLQDVNAKLRGE